MGMVHLVSLALFATVSVAARTPNRENLERFLNTDTHQDGGKKWVLLVAGSNGWENYRHQADICHAYQIVIRNQIPEENIITMMYDDIADNSENPTPGEIINRPNGTDVYSGVKIDYKGENVTSENFLKIIMGDVESMQSIGTGKVIEGGPRDTVFVYFSDHGGAGVLVFPTNYLYADQLNQALNTAFENANYKKMLLYIEACEAGSMFNGLLDSGINVLAVTASGPRESSWACYCEEAKYGTCLGDVFSVTWMETIDAITSTFTSRQNSVHRNYDQIRKSVSSSNVMMYGDLAMGSEKLSSFIGYNHDQSLKLSSGPLPKIKINLNERLSSRDVPVKSMERKLTSEYLTHESKQELAKNLRKNYQMRLIIDSVFRSIYSKVLEARPDVQKEIGGLDQLKAQRLTMDVFPCYRSIINKISDSCFSMPRNPYTLDQMTIFANLCVIDKQIHQMVGRIIAESCSNIPENIINVV